MNSEFPTILIFGHSRIEIKLAEGENLNSTRDVIVIRGSRSGFLSLANALLFLLNDLVDVMELNDLTYVSGHVRLTIMVDESVSGKPYGIITRGNQQQFLWRVSESETCRVASEIHSLGYINNELHLDQEKDPNEVSVYCVVT
jgi:hypothetical protein